MKCQLAAMSVLCALTAGGVQAAGTSHFSISIAGTGMASRTLELEAPPRGKTVVETLGELTVELTPRQSDHPSSTAIVRLLRNQDGTRMVLHTARVAEHSQDKVQMAYLLCDDTVTFMSPAPQVSPGCRAQTPMPAP